MAPVSERAHAHIIGRFGEVFSLCGQVRQLIGTLRANLTTAGFKWHEVSGADAYEKVADLERAATMLLRMYVDWASPLDVSGDDD